MFYSNKSNCLTSENSSRYNGIRHGSNLDNCIWENEDQNYSRQRESGGIMKDLAFCLLKDFVDHWMKTVKKNEVKPSTLDRLQTSLTALEPYSISSIPIYKITSDDFRAYINELIEDGYAATTIKKQMRIISAPMRYAYEQRIISFNPCQGVKAPSESIILKKKKDVCAYTKQEQERILDVLHKRDRCGYYAIELMLETGLRVGEALALNWDDIILNRRRINVHSTLVNLSNRNISYVQEGAKSETSNRAVPLSMNALNLLSELKDKNSRKPEVFLGSDGERLSYEALRYQCFMACKEADVPYLGLHVFRHTFATNQYYKGTDVKILSKLLGHADTSITYNIYIHLYGDGFDEMLNAVS